MLLFRAVYLFMRREKNDLCCVCFPILYSFGCPVYHKGSILFLVSQIQTMALALLDNLENRKEHGKNFYRDEKLN